MSDKLRVLHVSSECYPLVKTGGLADVTGALPLALATVGVDARVLLPAYRGVVAQVPEIRVVAKIAALFGGSARLLSGTTEQGLRVFLLDAPHLFDRPGGPYMDEQGHDHPDNDLRFAALSYVGAQISLGNIGRWRPTVLHAHDWQTGLAAAYLHFEGAQIPTLMTVHNLAFQGVFPGSRLAMLGLPPTSFTVDGLEYHGQISLLKAGLVYSSAITTVSPTYAQEIMTPEFGAGLDGLLLSRSSAVTGILNGLDQAVWDPAADQRIVAGYSPDDLSGKRSNKAALQAELGLAVDPALPLFGVVSRLSHQKGFDVLIEALPKLLAVAQLAVLGTGDPQIEQALAAAALEYPGQVGVRIGFNEDLAHRIQAAADVLLVPSRFEPCGLTQLSALRYGALPLVSRVGGLADTVIDANTAALFDGVATGFVFAPVTAQALSLALDRVFAVWAQPELWRSLVHRAMTRDVSWTQPARAYVALYKDLLSR